MDNGQWTMDLNGLYSRSRFVFCLLANIVSGPLSFSEAVLNFYY